MIYIKWSLYSFIKLKRTALSSYYITFINVWFVNSENVCTNCAKLKFPIFLNFYPIGLLSRLLWKLVSSTQLNQLNVKRSRYLLWQYISKSLCAILREVNCKLFRFESINLLFAISRFFRDGNWYYGNVLMKLWFKIKVLSFSNVLISWGIEWILLWLKFRIYTLRRGKKVNCLCY